MAIREEICNNVHFILPPRLAALIWQLMRAYTLSILTQLADTGSPIVEKEIIDWVNNKLTQGKKQTSIRNFQVRVVDI